MSLNKNNYSSSEQASEKSFGITFSIVFLIFAFYPFIYSEGLRIWALIVSIIFFTLAIIFPKILKMPNKVWLRFGLVLGYIIPPILMTFIYYSVILPTGILMRIAGKDLLKLKSDKNIKSYWIIRKKPLESMKNQF